MNYSFKYRYFFRDNALVLLVTHILLQIRGPTVTAALRNNGFDWWDGKGEMTLEHRILLWKASVGYDQRAEGMTAQGLGTGMNG